MRVPGRKRQQRRAQLQVHLLQQVHGDDRGHRQIGLEQVLLGELRTLGHAGLGGIAAAALHQIGHDLHPQSTRAEAPRRQDDDAPVAGAEVEHEVLRPDLGQFEHGQRDVVGGDDERHLLLRPQRGGRGQAQRQRGQYGANLEPMRLCHVA